MTSISLDLANGNLKIGTLEFTKQTTTEDFLKSEIGQRAKLVSKKFAGPEYVVADVDIWERKFNNSFWFKGNQLHHVFHYWSDGIYGKSESWESLSENWEAVEQQDFPSLLKWLTFHIGREPNKEERTIDQLWAGWIFDWGCIQLWVENRSMTSGWSSSWDIAPALLGVKPI